MFIASLFIIDRIQKQPNVQTDRWMDKEDGADGGILHNHVKDEIVPFATTWMGLEGVMLNEIGQIEKDKYRTISLICGI